MDIPDALFRRARRLAQQSGRTFRDLVIEGLRSVLAAGAARQPYRMKDRSFGEGGLVDGLSWSDAERIRDLVYEGRGS